MEKYEIKMHVFNSIQIAAEVGGCYYNSAISMVFSIVSTQEPTDFPSDMAAASTARVFSWRRRIRVVFRTAHLT